MIQSVSESHDYTLDHIGVLPQILTDLKQLDRRNQYGGCSSRSIGFIGAHKYKCIDLSTI